MDWLNLPPLNSLRAFAAVAGAGSYAEAADHLNVTQAAVSQQVKALERRLGVALVARVGRGIELTESGAHLARDLEAGFDIINRGVARINEAAAARPVQVTMSPAFAVEWLMPKIGEFQRAHPEITLMLNPTSHVVDLRPGGIDIAIRYRDRRRVEPDSEAFLKTDMVVIGTPDLAGERTGADLASLAELPWLQELGTNEAADWFTYHGIVPKKPLQINHMPGNLIMPAVRRGDGITYTARAFFVDDLAAGRVVELASETLFGFYYIETGPGEPRTDVMTFLKWLRTKAEVVTKPA
ncbi:LysR family transcriptional regulator [Primorskyibacter aestuariivivens]|uniref:LysR family transcriptional regulator n=1 Tax=Primorskyibacter aestuariivivens TaxID=1888912 RepID=UPI0023010F85|nr:LysR family transcriptional regulator [Primorskyibacter aestuariivivens]MDA7426927.1 LysR family transcriptional regulator [Primorskyibacter aestuariivivens]